MGVRITKRYTDYGMLIWIYSIYIMNVGGQNYLLFEYQFDNKARIFKAH